MNQNDIQEAVDTEWFLALKEIRRPLFLQSLYIPSQVYRAEKQAFLNEVKRNPDFLHPKLHGEEVEVAIRQLKDLRGTLCIKEADKSILSLYITKIDELLKEQYLLRAAACADWQQFKQLNADLYGGFDSSVLGQIINHLHTTYGYFNAPELDAGQAFVFSDVLIAEARKLLAGPDLQLPKGIYSSAAIVALWQHALNRFTDTWVVESGPAIRHMRVNGRRKRIFIPDDLRLSARRVRKLFVHEIGTHVYRRENGRMSKLRLLGSGLAGYLKAEEGIATVREQLIRRRITDFAGHDKYLAVAYATGHIDGEEKDFRSVYEFIHRYFSERYSRLGNVEHAAFEERVRERAWRLTVRVFRIGAPSLPGVCLWRDKLYREGNVYIWHLLQQHPEFFGSVYAGKFDPGNAEHRQMVETYAHR